MSFIRRYLPRINIPNPVKYTPPIQYPRKIVSEEIIYLPENIVSSDTNEEYDDISQIQKGTQPYSV